MINYIIWAMLIVLAIIMLSFYAKHRHPVRSALFGMLSGIVSLLLLYYFGSRIGVYADLNIFNISTALILGIPGVILIIAVNLI